MATDSVFHWTANGQRKELRVRWWWHGSPLPVLWRWLRELVVAKRLRWWEGEWFDMHFRTLTQGGMCYCPTGSVTELAAATSPAGVRVWLTRDWTKRPCHCDRVVEEFTSRPESTT